jgi:hypothetical protein
MTYGREMGVVKHVTDGWEWHVILEIKELNGLKNDSGHRLSIFLYSVLKFATTD